jgi:hypothetical protein
VTGHYVRFGLAGGIGALVWAFCAANFGEIGAIIGAVFGLGSSYFALEVLARRAEERLMRDKWKDRE